MHPTPPVTHPSWCSPLRCHDTDVDTQHCSELTSLRLRDAHLTLAWVAADEYAFPDEPGTPELRIDVMHSMQGQDSTLYLLPHEVHRLFSLLTAEYYRQQVLSTPIVRDSRAVA